MPHPLPEGARWDTFLTLILYCSMSPLLQDTAQVLVLSWVLGRLAHVYPSILSPTHLGLGRSLVLPPQSSCALLQRGHTVAMPLGCSMSCSPTEMLVLTVSDGDEVCGLETGESGERGKEREWDVVNTFGHQQGSHPSWQPDPRA